MNVESLSIWSFIMELFCVKECKYSLKPQSEIPVLYYFIHLLWDNKVKTITLSGISQAHVCVTRRKQTPTWALAVTLHPDVHWFCLEMWVSTVLFYNAFSGWWFYGAELKKKWDHKCTVLSTISVLKNGSQYFYFNNSLDCWKKASHRRSVRAHDIIQITPTQILSKKMIHII